MFPNKMFPDSIYPVKYKYILKLTIISCQQIFFLYKSQTWKMSYKYSNLY